MEKKPYDSGIKRLFRAFGGVMMRLNRTALFKRFSETERLEKTTWEYSHPLWPSSAEGFSALFVTDIHYGKLLSDGQWRRLTEAIASAESDAVLFGGDFGESPEDSLRCVAELAPLLEGRRVIAVPGNHDLIGGGHLESLLEAAEKAGWEMPVNGCVPLAEGAAVACVDDVREGDPDVEKARSESAGYGFTVLMTHNPDLLAGIPDPFYSLALCGHTHGGQVTVRGRAVIPSSEYGQRYVRGWKRENGADILICRGVGVSLLPVRIGAVPEVIRIVFRHGSEGHRIIGGE